jgi:DNA-binding transcriptional LysR family regulator
LSSRLLPAVLDSACELRPNTRFRLVEFGHNQLVAHGLNGAFEMAVHIEPLEWTRTWSSHELGKIPWRLYGSSKHPLCKLKMVREADVLKHQFVMPTGWSSQGFVRGEDHCPAPWSARRPGHEATTAETALEIVSVTSQLVFVPSILAERSLNHGIIKEIKVSEWEPVEKKIFLSVRDDLVPASLLKIVTELIRDRLMA